MIGGRSIPYAAMPMNNRTGITIGGTRYFMFLPLCKEPDCGVRSQHAGEYCRPKGKAG